MNRDAAFETWFRGEFGYDAEVAGEMIQAHRSAFEAGARFERDRARRVLTEKAAFAKVQNIPVPWNFEGRHTVVAVEYPLDRPRVVDLVFLDGTRLAETLNAEYAFDHNANHWTSVR